MTDAINVLKGFLCGLIVGLSIGVIIAKAPLVPAKDIKACLLNGGYYVNKGCFEREHFDFQSQ